MPLTHSFTNPIADEAGFLGTKPSDWNAVHTGSVVNADVDSAAAIDESKLALNFPTHAAVALGTANGLSLVGQQLSLALSATGTTGALSSVDWNTFNSKQAALGYTPVDIASANYVDLTDGGATTLHTHTGFGDISGTGVVGQVAEFVTDTKTLQAAKLIGPASNILTITNAAASTLALNITSAKTLTLTAADNYTLTIPATGTAALLATANAFSVAQGISVADAVTNTFTNVLTLDHITSGTAAASFGAQLLFRLESDSGNLRDSGSILSDWVTAADATRAGRIRFGIDVAGVMALPFVLTKTGLTLNVPNAGNGDALMQVQDSGTSYFRATKNSTNGHVSVTQIASSDKPALVVNQGSSGTGSLQEWRNSSAVALVSVSATGVLMVDGTSDQVQLRVQAHSTQTSNLVTIENSSAGVLGGFDSKGRVFSYGNPAVTSNLLLGSAGNATLTGTENIGIGDRALEAIAGGARNVAIGQQAGKAITSGNQNFALGMQAAGAITTGIDNIAIGYQALFVAATGVVGNIAIGKSALSDITGNQNVGIGTGAGRVITGTRNVVIGDLCASLTLTSGTGNVLLGAGITVTAGSESNSFGVGRDAIITASNQMVIGSILYPITESYIGEGVVSTSPGNILITTSGGSGSNIAGGTMKIAGGRGTGTGIGGTLTLQVAPAGASSSTLNALVDAIVIDSTKLITVGDAFNFAFNATTGTKIGTATTQKLGFWNVTPVIQPAGATQAAPAAYATGIFGLDSNANMQALYDLVVAMRTALVNSGIIKGAA